MALKELGLSLEQIGLMLNEEMPNDQIRGMLRLKQAEAQQQMRDAQQQLAMIEFRLHMIEAETNFPELDVVIKRLAPIQCLSFFPPLTQTLEAGWKQMATVANALKQAIATGVIKSTGVSVDKFFGSSLIEDSRFAFERQEILHGVSDEQGDVEIDDIGRLTVKEEPAVETAATIMLSAKEQPFMTSIEKVTLLRRWAAEHGYYAADYVRLYHFRGPLNTLAREEFVFEAQLPVVTTTG
jgi:DNA-binding transcriptional MerR regulator